MHCSFGFEKISLNWNYFLLKFQKRRLRNAYIPIVLQEDDKDTKGDQIEEENLDSRNEDIDIELYEDVSLKRLSDFWVLE